MSKPPIGAKKCAHPGCRKTFTAMGRRAYCDEHRPQANGRPAGGVGNRGTARQPKAKGKAGKCSVTSKVNAAMPVRPRAGG